MAKRKNPPLTSGPYISADPEASIAVWTARARLIGEIKRLLPEFLTELAESVFPAYAEAVTGELSYESWYEPFDQWSAKFHIDFGWMEGQAYHTLEAWRTDPALLAAREWSYPFYSRMPANAPGFQCDGWDMEIETFREYRKRVRKQFDEFLSGIEGDTHHFAEAKGLIPAPRQYSSQNIEWFVRYQFAGVTAKKIADSHAGTVEESAVLKGVKAAAKLLAAKLKTGSKKVIKAAPKVTELALRNAVQAALDSDDTGAYIAAANALDLATLAIKPNAETGKLGSR